MMSGDHTPLSQRDGGGPSPVAPGQTTSMQATWGGGDVPEENGECGGDLVGRRTEEEEKEKEEETEDWDDDLDSFQLEKRMKERRRAQSLPATFFEADLRANGEGRKRVKFADSIGLDLASVKHFNTLEDPQIPTKVLSRLRSFPPGVGDLCVGLKSTLNMDRLVRCFPEPAQSRGFEARVADRRVCLEKVTITQFDVRGQIRVRTTCPHQEVGVRYTFNDWLSHVDTQALAVDAQALAGAPADPQKPSLAGERFTFTMYTPPFLDPSSSVHFAVYLKCDEGDFWDNNEGKNYTLKYRCFPSSAPYVSAAFHAI
ncbi:hypothetical protein NHX12_021906 [Muraenolepis orangiensis]|uniref:CBM21 domain-containing protein n=1 Tax=Muraenolepis orangiensis TaxID=630683 RepID=A0A9Q0IVZ7_9TELE|nr:hypothetical protein NHX12_021906 [Muraenolepis orangiensis]